MKRIEIEDVAKRHGVPPRDYHDVANLATIFYGLTHDGSPDRECRRFCIASAVRVLGEMRRLIGDRNL